MPLRARPHSLRTTALSNINSINNKSALIIPRRIVGKNTPAFTSWGRSSLHISHMNLNLWKFPTSWLDCAPHSQPCSSFSVHFSVCLSCISISLSPSSRRSWQMFWRSVTWCSPACSVWRCCWSSWLSGSLATSRTRITASTASLSSSGGVLGRGLCP